MPAPTTSEEFLDLVRKSGVVEERRLDPQVEKLRTEGRMPGEPNKLAGVLVRDGLLTHFQAEQILQGKWRRFTIGKYKVLERLGSGGMGQVYLCEHKLMRRRVAVKVLPTARAAEESSLERFYREARAVAALDHPNIVHAYDIDQDESLHFLVMEYVDGASLQDIIKKSGPLDPVRAAHYIYQATQGLAHAHLAGLVHRDIKPGNLLVDRNGCLKILDMGLARFFNDEEDILTRKFDENVLGTADYLAPEQAVDSHEADTRADIYSLGATFYFLLTGRTPFEEGTVAQKLIWHQTRQPKPIGMFRDDVPAEMIAIVEKMMAKAPEDRYQHPLEVAEALKPWLGQDIPPPPESEMPRLSPAASGASASLAETSMSAQTQKSIGASSSKKSWEVTPAAPSPPPQRPSASSPVVPRSPPAASPSRQPSPQSRTPLPPKSPVPSAPAPKHPRAEPTAKMNSEAPQVPAAKAPLLPPLPSSTGGFNWDNLAAGEVPTAVHGNATAESSSLKRSKNNTALLVGLLIALVLGVMFVAVLAVVLIRYFFFTGTTSVTPARPPLKVASGGSRGTFGTIQRALREARKGDVIELWDKRHEENVIVDPHKGTTEVTIRAAPGKTVVWTCPKGAERGPLLQLNNADNFHLEGKGITLDGQGKMPSLIHAALRSTALTIEDAELKGFTKEAIQLTNCHGADNDPAVFRNLAFIPAGNASAFYFDARPNFSPPFNDYIHITGCRFDNMAAQQRVRKNQKLKVLGDHVQLP